MPTHLADVAPSIFTVDVCIMAADEVLMFRRSASRKAFPGWLALPGGHIEEGEDPMATAIREIKEETGVEVSPRDIQLKFVCFHHHIDRNELFIVFGYLAKLSVKPAILKENSEGEPEWIKEDTLRTLDTVFPPVQYYFPHLLSGKPGILYNYSIWNNAKLVRVISEHLDKNT